MSRFSASHQIIAIQTWAEMQCAKAFFANRHWFVLRSSQIKQKSTFRRWKWNLRFWRNFNRKPNSADWQNHVNTKFSMEIWCRFPNRLSESAYAAVRIRSDNAQRSMLCRARITRKTVSPSSSVTVHLFIAPPISVQTNFSSKIFHREMLWVITDSHDAYFGRAVFFPVLVADNLTTIWYRIAMIVFI